MKNAKATLNADPVPQTPSAIPQKDVPTELPYPGYARELAALNAKAADAQRARGVALPGPLREAFAGEPRIVHGFTFQPVCAWLVAILTRIESPLLEIVRIYREHMDDLRELSTKPKAGEEKKHEAALQAFEKKLHDQIEREIKPGPDAILETVFAFITPVEALQDLLDEDRRTFTRAAQRALGKLRVPALAELERACGEHFSASFSTALSVSPKPPEGPGDGSVFYPPPAKMKTASAGGSKSLAP